MPIREYVCPKHGKFEIVVIGLTQEFQMCPVCKDPAIVVEFSVPAKRNPRYGEG